MISNRKEHFLVGQFMCRRLYLKRLRGDLSESTRLLVTGGAAKNKAICQILADIFGVAVYTLCNEVTSSAALGGALLAFRCVNPLLYSHNREMFQTDAKVMARPRNTAAYTSLLPRFERCLERHNLL